MQPCVSYNERQTMQEYKGARSPTLPNCLKCVFFKVSWDAAKPRQCVHFNFKSRDMPSHVVFHATGMICPHFQKKQGT